MIDYEFAQVEFGPWGPDFGQTPLPLGELPPGNYTITARLHAVDNPTATARTATGTIAVVPPDGWGIYSVPAAPQARSGLSATIHAAWRLVGRAYGVSVSVPLYPLC